MTLFIVTGVGIFVLGLLGVIVRKGYLHKLISVNIFTSGIFLIFISTTMQDANADPIVTALVLTGLVVTLGATAFGVMLIRAYYKEKSLKEQSEQEEKV